MLNWPNHTHRQHARCETVADPPRRYILASASSSNAPSLPCRQFRKLGAAIPWVVHAGPDTLPHPRFSLSAKVTQDATNRGAVVFPVDPRRSHSRAHISACHSKLDTSWVENENQRFAHLQLPHRSQRS